MSDFVAWMFLRFWEYTKLTFYFFRWLVRLIVAIMSALLNQREFSRPSRQGDLLERSRRKQSKRR